jgi:hypothetical protein
MTKGLMSGFIVVRGAGVRIRGIGGLMMLRAIGLACLGVRGDPGMGMISITGE